MKIVEEGGVIPNGFSRFENRKKYQFRFNRLLISIRYSTVTDHTLFRFMIGPPKGSTEVIMKTWGDLQFQALKYFTWDRGFAIKGRTGVFY